MSGTARALYLMNGGWLRLERSFLTGEGAGHVLVPIPMALVDTADGYVVFDTGMNCEGIRDPAGTWGPRAQSIQPRLVPEDDIRHRLGDLGVRHEDVRLVINSHLHWDHCGGNRCFAHCPVLVQRAELTFARAPSGPVQGGYMANHFEVPVAYQPLDGDEDVAPGVRVLLGLLVACPFLAQVATQAGWFTAEMGRQPWIVYEVLKTGDAVSAVVRAPASA
jgi:glyoxylase-like metal-dependent hydrolase (beta-lactamase superfamily II)